MSEAEKRLDTKSLFERVCTDVKYLLNGTVVLAHPTRFLPATAH